MIYLKAAYHLANVHILNEYLLLIQKKLNMFLAALRWHIENLFVSILQVAVIDICVVLDQRMN